MADELIGKILRGIGIIVIPLLVVSIVAIFQFWFQAQKKLVDQALELRGLKRKRKGRRKVGR
ncbi:MAG: hypothetical protein CR991_10265 [Proteobacteria bacterium]|nr:MAG: hypothetical protein CR991_10265 [Pseudomonadota bacterium]